MAYKRRKEIVENQIKEHNLEKRQALADAKASLKCPFKNNTENTEATESTDANKDKNEPESEQVVSKCPKTNNKNIVVTIQTNEEKSKENIMSKLLFGL